MLFTKMSYYTNILEYNARAIARGEPPIEGSVNVEDFPENHIPSLTELRERHSILASHGAFGDNPYFLLLPKSLKVEALQRNIARNLCRGLRPNMNGRLKGRYELGKELGRGAWGAVYEAFDREENKKVAIKVLDPTESALKELVETKTHPLEALRREARDTTGCRNVVPRRVERDAWDATFIVMPLYDKFLKDVIIDGQMVLKYARDVAHGLRELHGFGVVHGDLKPDNIALDKDKAMISDLGISTVDTAEFFNQNRTNGGCRYVRAPECFAKGYHPTMKADIWNFGSLLYKMLTGRYIFEGLCPHEKYSEFIEGLDEKTGDKLVEERLMFNDSLNSLFRKALAFDPKKRCDAKTLEKMLESEVADSTEIACYQLIHNWAC